MKPKYIKLKPSQLVKDGDLISAKGNLYGEGLIEVGEGGEIHIGHTITGTEACDCFRVRANKKRSHLIK